MPSGGVVLLCAAAWAVPGAGHYWLGQRSRGAAFFITLTLMFLIGLLAQGRLFPFDFSEPLVGLAAFADLGIGMPYFIASAFSQGLGYSCCGRGMAAWT